MYKTGILFLFSLLTLHAFAQSPADSVRMDSVIISANRTSVFAAGIKTVRFDSTTASRYSNSGIGDMLSSESEVFIKSYGPGSLATSSFRGAGANHTALVWNGIPISTPTNGLTDLSLLPVLFFDEVTIQYGGSGTLWGSGNVGGAVLLNSELSHERGLQSTISANLGSWQSSQMGFRFFTGGKKTGFSLRAFSNTGENNFPYRNYTLAGSPAQRLKNAALSQQGFLTGFSFRPNQKNEISIHGWLQFSDRQIPPSLTQSDTKAFQNDKSIRVVGNWKYIREKSKLILRSAYLDEWLHYEDSVYQIFSKSRAISFVNEAEMTIRLFPSHLVQFGLMHTITDAFTEGYSFGREQKRFAGFAAFAGRMINDRFNYSFGFREEIVGKNFTPFIPSAGFTFQFFKWMDLRLNATRSYRLPTFNDLYWTPGGNPDLLPEYGWSSDAGLSFHLHYKKWKLESDAGAFYRRLKNWIIWLPSPMGFWSPDNVLEVLSRGIESSHQLIFTSGNWKTNLTVHTSYVVSTNEKASSANDASLGKQLIYVPYNKTTASLFLQWKNWSLYSNFAFTGFRYTSSDNSVFLPAYSVFSSRFAWNGKIKNDSYSFFFEVNNLLDAHYETISSRPMPGRNFRIGIQCSINYSYINHSNKN